MPIINEFIRYILSETGSAAQLACVATAVVLVISLLCFLLQKRRGGSGAFPWKRLIGPVLLAGYLVMLVYTPSAVEVTSVELTYCTDTKGYRQPVYCFSLRYGIGDEIEEEVLVPALA
jgi:hypothetical protein